MFTIPVTATGDGDSNTAQYAGIPAMADLQCSHHESFKCYTFNTLCSAL